jgi:hypothetical protein
MDSPLIARLDRRVAIKWLAAAVASLGIQNSRLSGARVASITPNGDGMSPELLRSYSPGELWPLTLNQTQRPRLWQGAAQACIAALGQLLS